MEQEQVERFADHSMIATLRLLDAMQMGIEIFFLEERRPVNPLEHLAMLIAAPIGTRRRHQLEVLEIRRVRDMRTAAEIDERAVGVSRDHLVVTQLAQPLELERIFGEALLRLRA